MHRGAAKDVGAEFTNANGYTYVKTEHGWAPKQKVIAEEKIGRALNIDERAYFIDGDRLNLDPSNIDVKVVHDKRSPQGQLLIVQAKIDDLRSQLEEHEELKRRLEKQIAEQSAR
jgi:hypothetical protein